MSNKSQIMVDEVGVNYLERLFPSEMIIVGATKGDEPCNLIVNVNGIALPDGAETPETEVIVYKIVENGTPAQFLESLGKDRRLWTSRTQMFRFIFDHPLKIRGGGHLTVFEFDGNIIAKVNIDPSGSLNVCGCNFSRGDILIAKFKHQVVALR